MSKQAPFSQRSSYNSSHSRVRKNERIRVPEVRLIGPDGTQLGVMQTREAQKLAVSYGLDLVEIAPNATPPVCRILDFGKYLYEEGKKTKSSKSTSTKLKELKFRIGIDQHDYMTKLRHAEGFLFKGNKVKFTLMLRGREMERKDMGVQVLNRAMADLHHVGSPDGSPAVNGRNIILTLSPLPSAKRKLKLNPTEENLPEDIEEE